MQRFIPLYILLFFLSAQAYSQSISIFNFDNSKYPIMEAGVYVFDAAGKPLRPSKANFSIKEAGQNRSILDLKCTGIDNNKAISAALTIDVSESMKGSNFELAKEGLKAWINLLPANSRSAIIAFNHYNELLQDFTEDKDKLTSALNKVVNKGGTNFNAAFIDEPSGALKALQAEQNKRIVILLTDGSASGNEEEIIARARGANAIVYCILIGGYTPPILKNIARETAGACFDNINTKEEIILAYNSILQLAQENFPCQITWLSEGCSAARKGDIFYSTPTASGTFDYMLPEEKLPALKISFGEFYDFGFLAPGTTESHTAYIRAVNGSARISSISPVKAQNDISAVSEKPLPYTLNPGDSLPIKLTYTVKDTNFTFSGFNISTDACKGSYFYSYGGSRWYKDTVNSIEIVSPNGGEVLFTGADTSIIWRGVLPTDSVELYYSYDGGAKWNEITKNAFGLKHIWQPPNTPSTECIMRSVKVYKKQNIDKIQKIPAHIGVINGLDWKNGTYELATGSDDGTVKIWDPISAFEKAQIAEDLVALDDLNWHPSLPLIAFSTSESNITVANELSGNTEALLVAGNGRVNCLSWNNTGEYIAAGTATGWVYVWKYPNPIPISALKRHNSIINDISWAKNENKFATVSDDSLAFIWSLSDTLFRVNKYKYRLKGISWNAIGANVAICGQTDTVDIWDVKTEPRLKSPIFRLNAGTGPYAAVQYDPQERYIAGIEGKNLRVWNINDGKELFAYTHTSAFRTLRWSSDGKYISLASNDHFVHVLSPDDAPFQEQKIFSDTSDKRWTIAEFKLEASDVNLGKTLVDAPLNLKIQRYLRNNSIAPLRIDSITFSGADAALFSMNASIFPKELKPGENVECAFSFVSPGAGIKSANIIIHTNVKKVVKLISAQAVLPDVIAVEKLLDFGEVNIEDSLLVKKVLIKNISGAAVTITSTRISDPEIFINKSESSFRLNPQESKEISILFKPKEAEGKSSSIIFKYGGFGDSSSVRLFGRGTAPALSTDTVQISKIVCENTLDTLISIKNKGTGVLKLLNATTEGEFETVEYNNDVLPGKDLRIMLRFKPSSPGFKEGKLNLKTNKLMSGDNSIAIVINGAKGSAGFTLSKDSTVFLGLAGMQIAKDTFYIRNAGSEPLEWSAPIVQDKFMISSIEPATTPAGDSSMAVVEFMGGEEGNSYSSVFNLTSICSISNEYKATAYVGSSSTFAQSPPDFEFPPIICDASSKGEIIIKNTGSNTLIMSKVGVSGENKDNFLPDVPGNIVVSAGEEYKFIIQFVPSNPGDYKAKLEILSNARNYTSGLITIDLKGKKLKSSFISLRDSIKFKPVQQGEQDTVYFFVVNNGTAAIHWKKDENLRFSFEPMESETLPGDTATFRAVFKGGIMDNHYRDSLNIVDDCGNIKKIYLYARALGPYYAIIQAGEVQAKPGEKASIPIRITNPRRINLKDISGIQVDMAFDVNILHPYGMTPDGIIEGSQRILSLNIQMPTVIPADSVIAIYEFSASAGAKGSSPLVLNNAEIVSSNPDYYIIAKSGKFSLSDSSVLVQNTGELYLGQNYPNEAAGITKIEFYLIESGYTELTLYDASGAKAEIIYSEDAEPGMKTVFFDSSKYAIGAYFYTLRTPTATLIKKMWIVR